MDRRSEGGKRCAALGKFWNGCGRANVRVVPRISGIMKIGYQGIDSTSAFTINADWLFCSGTRADTMVPMTNGKP